MIEEDLQGPTILFQVEMKLCQLFVPLYNIWKIYFAGTTEKRLPDCDTGDYGRAKSSTIIMR